MHRTHDCTVVVAGRPYAPGTPFLASEHELEHLRGQGISLEIVEEAPPAAPEDDQPPEPPAASLEERVAALSSKDDAVALATELGFILSETKLSKMRAEILELASKAAEAKASES